MGSTLNLSQVLKLLAQEVAQTCDLERWSTPLLDTQKQDPVPMLSQFASAVADAQLWRIFKEEILAQRVEDHPACSEPHANGLLTYRAPVRIAISYT